jgi:hypothetical protein
MKCVDPSCRWCANIIEGHHAIGTVECAMTHNIQPDSGGCNQVGFTDTDPILQFYTKTAKQQHKCYTYNLESLCSVRPTFQSPSLPRTPPT